jgi:hypothetical protein
MTITAAGVVKDAPRDMAENHDKYLYGGREG